MAMFFNRLTPKRSTICSDKRNDKNVETNPKRCQYSWNMTLLAYRTENKNIVVLLECEVA